ncbi:YggT family protein [Ferrithrix thermotolerans DSM 19514]|jgi:YggT family protein|uniref:YggT family protein n=1 Tax=Ferrithrix thermotolerans DSM 19514 TaxID=1121881 RepID=A0A1M4TSX1_9ACTN|nr:YggT family protein [Ferrithrix thermotolerans]SHE47552.1 YggT family protein [Ferrithrix thermotolerans DSM 19514]
MGGIQSLIRSLLELYVIVIVVQIVLSYFPSPPESALYKTQMFLSRFTEPVLAPVRRVMPRIGSGPMTFDLSPLVVILLIQWVIVPIV